MERRKFIKNSSLAFLGMVSVPFISEKSYSYDELRKLTEHSISVCLDKQGNWTRDIDITNWFSTMERILLTQPEDPEIYRILREGYGVGKKSLPVPLIKYIDNPGFYEIDFMWNPVSQDTTIFTNCKFPQPFKSLSDDEAIGKINQAVKRYNGRNSSPLFVFGGVRETGFTYSPYSEDYMILNKMENSRDKVKALKIYDDHRQRMRAIYDSSDASERLHFLRSEFEKRYPSPASDKRPPWN